MRGPLVRLVAFACALGAVGACGPAKEGPAAASARARPVRRPVGAILDRARDRLREGDEAGAAAAYREVLAIEPEHAASLYSLAMLERRGGRPAAAIELCDRLAAVDGIPSRAHLLKAAILSDPAFLPRDAAAARADLETALAEATVAVRSNPEDSGTHAARGRVLLLLGRAEEARRDLRRALGLNPKDEDSALWLAIALARSGDATAAREVLREHGAAPAAPHRPGVREEGDTADGSAAAPAAGGRTGRLLAWLDASVEPLDGPAPPAPEGRSDVLGVGLVFAAEVLGGASFAYAAPDGGGIVLSGSGLVDPAPGPARRLRPTNAERRAFPIR